MFTGNKSQRSRIYNYTSTDYKKNKDKNLICNHYNWKDITTANIGYYWQSSNGNYRLDYLFIMINIDKYIDNV